MTPEAKNNPNFIKGYNLYISENPDNPTKTGIGMAIKTDIPHRRIDIPLDNTLLAIAFEIDFPTKITLVSIYISPATHQINNQIKNSLEKILDHISSPVLLMGDFNGHSTLWGGQSKDSRGLIVEQIIDEYGLTLLNDGTHTRISPSSGASSALDLSIASHNLCSQLSWKVHNDCCGSDHLPIVITLNRAPPVSSCRPRWKYELADWESYRNEILSLFTENPPTSAEEFTKQLFDVASHHIPRTSGAPGKKAVPWWNPEVRSAVKLRRKKLRALQKVAKEDRKDSAIFAEFKTARNAARAAVKKAKQDSWD